MSDVVYTEFHDDAIVAMAEYVETSGLITFDGKAANRVIEALRIAERVMKPGLLEKAYAAAVYDGLALTPSGHAVMVTANDFIRRALTTDDRVENIEA